MKKYFLLPIIALLFSTTLLAKGVTVFIDLSPAGSFEAKAKSVKGKAVVKGDSVVAENLTVSVKKLKTGLDLRDDHLKKKLNSKKYPKIKMVKAVGKGGKGTALFDIRGVKGKVPFTYKKVDSKYMKADFKINLKKFKFEGIKYMGVGVKDNVRIEAFIRYK
ncbi:MAG: hypothetical protein CME70_20590 [Halobacteriovorax sp.]|nr:hypothetical protein [Halobacteriovorax sp.]|tara:strand:- start:10481 stop:10966 length:486 start_codon:yes stop_codon:yes gene_type:complete